MSPLRKQNKYPASWGMNTNKHIYAYVYTHTCMHIYIDSGYLWGANAMRCERDLLETHM